MDFHLKTQEKEGQFIPSSRQTPRERLLDLCSLCHGGQLNKTNLVQFPGRDTLGNYRHLSPPDPNINNIDVHGNQMGLLTSVNVLPGQGYLPEPPQYP